jgi:hypothetical protein
MKLIAYILSCSVFSIAPALAGPLLIIKPEGPEGTDIRNAFRRVTLSVDGDPTREVRAVDGFDAFNGRNPATTGTLVFGYSPTLPHATGEGKVWDEDTFGLLRADFKQLADTVEIDLIFDDDDTGVLRAYDACGNLLQTVQANGDGRGPTPVTNSEVGRQRSGEDNPRSLAKSPETSALAIDSPFLGRQGHSGQGRAFHLHAVGRAPAASPCHSRESGRPRTLTDSPLLYEIHTRPQPGSITVPFPMWL